jgi:hypothetical protein
VNRRDPLSAAYTSFVAICRRPQWLPLAVVMTMLTVMYISIHDSGVVRGGGGDTFIGDGKTDASPYAVDAVNRAIADARAHVIALPSLSGDAASVAVLSDSLSRVHSCLVAKYVRYVDIKVVAASSMLLLHSL